MRILVIASTFPASDSDPVPAFVRDQIIALKNNNPKMEFSVLAPHDKRSKTRSFTKHESYDEYRFHYFWPFSLEKLAGRGIMPALKANPLNYLLIPFLFIGEFFALLWLTIKLKPTVIYAHWFTPQAINARWVGALTKTSFVFTTHASDVDVWHKIPLIGGAIVRSNTRKAHAFTAVSRRSMEKLERFFSSAKWDSLKKRGAIIPMGVDLPRVSTRQTNQMSKYILFVGRLAEKKGVRYLLDAFAAITPQNQEVRLIVAGDGPLRKSLEVHAQDLGISDKVEFTGYVSGKEKEELIQNACLYAVPSIITSDGDAEGLPVSLMEGLAYGKVCIATNESGADDILTDRKDGFLVPQKDIEKLTAALRDGLSLSKTAYTTISNAAQYTAKQFAWSEVARQHSAFLFKDLND
jgi:glycosyltransferase involved in cell wall biosynthesis